VPFSIFLRVFERSHLNILDSRFFILFTVIITLIITTWNIIMKAFYTLFFIVFLSNYCFSDDSSQLNQKKPAQSYNQKATLKLKKYLLTKKILSAMAALDAGADPMVEGYYGENVAQLAVEINNLKLLKKYHEKGGNLEIKIPYAHNNFSLLDLAIAHAHIDIYKYLVKTCPKLIREESFKSEERLCALLRSENLTVDHHEAITIFLRNKETNKEDP
jgi:hypothetical protein